MKIFDFFKAEKFESPARVSKASATQHTHTHTAHRPEHNCAAQSFNLLDHWGFQPPLWLCNFSSGLERQHRSDAQLSGRLCFSRHHASPIEGSPKTLRTSQHYHIEGLNVGPEFFPLLCRETLASRTANDNFSRPASPEFVDQAFLNLRNTSTHQTFANLHRS